MRAHFLAALACALAAACSGGSSSRTLVLIHTNDEHSHILGATPEVDDFPPSQTAGSGVIKGGTSRRATIFAAERARAKQQGAASLTVSAGDSMIGSLIELTSTAAAPDFRSLKILGYDVNTLGNHEFDFGPDNLAKTIQVAMGAEGMVPTVASNIRFNGASTLEALYDPTGNDASKPLHKKLVVTASNGLRVGFVGVVGQDAAAKAPAKSPVTFSKADCCDETNQPAVIARMIEDLQPIVTSLHKDDKVDLVVLLSHAGLNLKNLPASEDYALATQVKGIDVIVSGHTHDVFPATVVTNPDTRRPVLIQQAGRYGEYVGRIQLTVDGDKNITFDTKDSLLIPVDDTVVNGSTAIDQLATTSIAALETVPVVTTPTALSFLEYTIYSSIGQPVHHGTPGSLYFYPLGKTGFDVAGPVPFKETQAHVLAADAELWAAETFAGLKGDVAIFPQGAVRAPLTKGKTGVLSFADVFNVVPLGGSPVTGTPGYPMCRFALSLAEIKAAFDLVAAGFAQQTVSNSDYFLVTAGMRITYDLSRPAFDPSGDALDPRNGRVLKIEIAHDHTNGVYETYDQVIYDAGNVTGGKPDPFFGGVGKALAPYVVIANLYVAQLSYVGGVKLKDPATGAVYASPLQSIIHRSNGTEIKDWEAMAGYIATQSALNGNTLPARYNAAVSAQARRSVCTGPACP